jgi:hypothetical protein
LIVFFSSFKLTVFKLRLPNVLAKRFFARKIVHHVSRICCGMALMSVVFYFFYFSALPASADATFPPKTLVSLTGQKRAFFKPVESGGKTSRYILIALGFNPKKQAELEQGVTLASQVATTHPLLEVVEIAVLPQKYEGSRGLIQNFMKAAVQNKKYLPQVYPLFDDVNALKRIFGLNAAQDMVFLLCNAKGEIVWKSPEKPQPDWKRVWVSKLPAL